MKGESRQQKFASEYVRNGFNGAQAVIAAGYDVNYNSACVQASRLLRNAKVKQRIKSHLQKAADKADLTAERVTQEIAKVAYSEVKIIGSDKMKALDMAAAILGIKKADQPQESVESTERIAKVIAAASERDGQSATEAEANLQLRFSNPDDAAYDPSLDPTKNPQVWPSGCLIAQDAPASKAVN